jgi:hypothetical protein
MIVPPLCFVVPLINQDAEGKEDAKGAMAQNSVMQYKCATQQKLN